MNGKLSVKRRKDGFTDFYYGKRNITALWMDFFSTLPAKKERDCVELFIKKHGKKLDKLNAEIT